MHSMRALLLVLLAGCGGCTAHWVRCERHLQPINPPGQPAGQNVGQGRGVER